MGYTIAYKTQRNKDFRPITFISGGIDSARKEAVREHRSWNRRWGNNETKIAVYKDGKMFGEVYLLYGIGYMWCPKTGGEYPIYDKGNIGKNRIKR